MAKTAILARIRTTGDALSATFSQVSPTAWNVPVSADQLTPHDVVNFAMGLLELAGNWYLQSLRMDPIHDLAGLESEAWQHAAGRRSRSIQSDLDDFQAALQGLLILIDMATEAQLQGLVSGKSREEWFGDVAAILQSTQQHLQRLLDQPQVS